MIFEISDKHNTPMPLNWVQFRNVLRNELAKPWKKNGVWYGIRQTTWVYVGY